VLLINAAAVPAFPALEVSMPKPIPVISGCSVLSKYFSERSVEVEFGDYRLLGLRFAQENEAAACMKVLTFIRKVDFLVLTEKESNEIGTVGINIFADNWICREGLTARAVCKNQQSEYR
jgi:hypothetical protein